MFQWTGWLRVFTWTGRVTTLLEDSFTVKVSVGWIVWQIGVFQQTRWFRAVSNDWVVLRAKMGGWGCFNCLSGIHCFINASQMVIIALYVTLLLNYLRILLPNKI